MVAKTLEVIGMDRLITFDLHSKQIAGYFKNPPIILSAFPLFINEIRNLKFGIRNLILVAPDEGAYWTKGFANKLGIGLVQMDKTRDKVTARISENLMIHGDVNGKTCIIIDDNIYTGKTLILNAKALKDKGARAVLCYVTHPILSGNAPKLLQESEIDSLTVTDTIFVPKEKIFSKLKIISIAHPLAEAIGKMI